MVLNGAVSAPLVMTREGEEATVIFATSDERVYSVNIPSGGLNWQFPAGRAIVDRPIVIDDRVFVGTLQRTKQGRNDDVSRLVLGRAQRVQRQLLLTEPEEEPVTPGSHGGAVHVRLQIEKRVLIEVPPQRPGRRVDGRGPARRAADDARKRNAAAGRRPCAFRGRRGTSGGRSGAIGRGSTGGRRQAGRSHRPACDSGPEPGHPQAPYSDAAARSQIARRHRGAGVDVTRLGERQNSYLT